MTASAASVRSRRRGLGALVRLGLATALVGVAAGLAVMVLVWAVHSLEHLVWGHEEGPFLDGLAYPDPWWLPIVTVGGAGVGVAVGWYVLRRFGRPIATVEQGVDGARMPWWETLVDTLLQVGSVAMGASIGKEVAPRELSAMAGSKVVRWFGLDARWCRILIASAAGAGLAAVYNVPLGVPSSRSRSCSPSSAWAPRSSRSRRARSPPSWRARWWGRDRSTPSHPSR